VVGGASETVLLEIDEEDVDLKALEVVLTELTEEVFVVKIVETTVETCLDDDVVAEEEVVRETELVVSVELVVSDELVVVEVVGALLGSVTANIT
jgi:hypothetical protein